MVSHLVQRVTFSTTSITINGFTYTVDTPYMLALPLTGVGGGAGTGTTTIQGTVTGGVLPGSIAKSFAAGTIPVTGTTTLTFTLTNPNAATALSGVAFTDPLPAGLIVASPNGLSNTCGGTVTANAGTSSISLAGGSLAANASCTIGVTVQATSSGTLVNTTGAVTSVEGGTGNTATATLNVTALSVPALSLWALALLALLLAAVSPLAIRQRRRARGAR